MMKIEQRQIDFLREQVNDLLICKLPKNIQDEARQSYVLAGGAIASTVRNEIVNDYDIWFTDQKVLVKVLEWALADLSNDYVVKENSLPALFKESTVSILQAGSSSSGYWLEEVFADNEAGVKCVSSRAVTFLNKIQIITNVIYSLEGFIWPNEIISSFDFIHNTCWIMQTREYVPDSTIDLITGKKLMFNYGCSNPVDALRRAEKFKQRGYTINSDNYYNILCAIRGLDGKQFKMLFEASRTSSAQ